MDPTEPPIDPGDLTLDDGKMLERGAEDERLAALDLEAPPLSKRRLLGERPLTFCIFFEARFTKGPKRTGLYPK